MNERVYYSRDAEMRAQRQQFVLVVAATAVSLSVGALIALLLAPRTGKEIRRTLGEQIDQAYNTGREIADQVRRDVEERVQNVR